MFPTYGYFEKYNKKDRSSCLFERNDGPDLPIYALFANFHAPHFMIYFLVAGSKGFESKN